MIEKSANLRHNVGMEKSEVSKPEKKTLPFNDEELKLIMKAIKKYGITELTRKIESGEEKSKKQ